MDKEGGNLDPTGKPHKIGYLVPSYHSEGSVLALLITKGGTRRTLRRGSGSTFLKVLHSGPPHSADR